SSNTYSSMIKMSRETGHVVLIFPEYVIAFDRNQYIYKYFPLRDVTPLAFVSDHPFISRAFAPASIFQTIRYRETHPLNDFWFEDWHFSAECVANSVDIRIAENTVLFYRQRAASIMAEARMHADRHISPCSLLKPSTFLQVTRGYSCTSTKNR